MDALLPALNFGDIWCNVAPGLALSYEKVSALSEKGLSYVVDSALPGLYRGYEVASDLSREGLEYFHESALSKIVRGYDQAYAFSHDSLDYVVDVAAPKVKETVERVSTLSREGLEYAVRVATPEVEKVMGKVSYLSKEGFKYIKVSAVPKAGRAVFKVANLSKKGFKYTIGVARSKWGGWFGGASDPSESSPEHSSTKTSLEDRYGYCRASPLYPDSLYTCKATNLDRKGRSVWAGLFKLSTLYDALAYLPRRLLAMIRETIQTCKRVVVLAYTGVVLVGRAVKHAGSSVARGARIVLNDVRTSLGILWWIMSSFGYYIYKAVYIVIVLVVLVKLYQGLRYVHDLIGPIDLSWIRSFLAPLPEPVTQSPPKKVSRHQYPLQVSDIGTSMKGNEPLKSSPRPDFIKMPTPVFPSPPGTVYTPRSPNDAALANLVGVDQMDAEAVRRRAREVYGRARMIRREAEVLLEAGRHDEWVAKVNDAKWMELRTNYLDWQADELEFLHGHATPEEEVIGLHGFFGTGL